MVLIKVKNLTKYFKISKRDKGFWGALKGLFVRKKIIKKALDGVSFEIADGEIVGYLGPNGAGKSTTIKIMCGILTPTSGECEINGFVPYKQREKYVKNIGVVFGQRSQLFWDVPVIDSYYLLKDVYKIPKDKFEERLKMLTETLELEELLDIPLRQMSLGQKMKCELAGSLLHDPKILFLDEPTIGLDAVSKLQVREFVKKINKELGVTVILTTHDMNDIEALTNRIILIGKGKILYDGSFSEIKEKYRTEKIITVQYAQAYEDYSLEGYELLEVVDKTAKYKFVGEFHLPKFTNFASKKYDIIDIQVDDLGLEEIMSKLYQEFEI